VAPIVGGKADLLFEMLSAQRTGMEAARADEIAGNLAQDLG
jgi:hypothetical protein